MDTIFSALKKHLDSKLPFAVYCKPGSDTITGVFQKNNVEYNTRDFFEEGFVFAPFEFEKAVLIPFKEADIITERADNQNIQETEPEAVVTDSNAKSEFEFLVKKSVEKIIEGTFKKVVVSRKEIIDTDKPQIELIFKKILSLYPSAFRYCFYSKSSGMWLGATPEQLVKVNGHEINTVALAGTQLYNDTRQAVWHDKEKQEQQFVTDYITESLKNITTDSVATQPYTYRAGNLVHIKTDISAKLKNNGLKDIINALHPTPAICGLPKIKAKKFLKEHEGYEREYYSGFLGEINKEAATGTAGISDLFVNLRCMKIENNKVHLYIGCGITKDSDPEKEFIETVNKSVTMRRVI